MYFILYIVGFISGVFMPHANIYAKVCDHFLKCMRKRDKQIHDLMVERHKLKKIIILNNLKNVRNESIDNPAERRT